MTRFFFLALLLAGCASPTQPSEPLATGRQSLGYETTGGTVVRWGDVRTNEKTPDGGSPDRDYSDRSVAR